MGNVHISPNLKKTSERIDPQGNVINPRTKEIISPNVDLKPENQEPVQVVTPLPEAQNAPVTSAKSIQEQIDEAEQHVAKLKELKKAKIEQMKAELAALEE